MMEERGSNDLPKWLLEFDKFSKHTHSEYDLNKRVNGNDYSSYNHNTSNTSHHNNNNNKQTIRPLTEDSNCKKPKWFEDIQRRRLSELPRIELHQSTSDMQEYHLKVADSKVSLSDESESVELSITENDANYLSFMNDRKLSTEFRYLDREYLTSPNGGSSRDESSKSSIISDTDLIENELMSFSTIRSLEKIKLHDVPEIEDCIIPEMPSGSVLSIRLIDNWGDDQYIGLNGIEIIDSEGNHAKVQNIYIRDSYDNRIDSKELYKLVDNVNRTHDDSHIWQYRLIKKNMPLEILIEFSNNISIALLRIWNYNKSRIHSFRGTKNTQMRLDNRLIFSGEIAKASGDLLGSVESFGDTILFTTDEKILDQIFKSDAAFQDLMFY